MDVSEGDGFFEKGGCDNKKRISGQGRDIIELTVTKPGAKVWAGYANGHEAVKLTPVLTIGGEVDVEAVHVVDPANRHPHGDTPQAENGGDTPKVDADRDGRVKDLDPEKDKEHHDPPKGVENAESKSASHDLPHDHAFEEHHDPPEEHNDHPEEHAKADEPKDWAQTLLSDHFCSQNYLEEMTTKQLQHLPIENADTALEMKSLEGSIPAQLSLQFRHPYVSIVLESSQGGRFENGACDGQRVLVRSGEIWPPLTVYENRQVNVWALYSVEGSHILYRTKPFVLEWKKNDPQKTIDEKTLGKLDLMQQLKDHRARQQGADAVKAKRTQQKGDKEHKIEMEDHESRSQDTLHHAGLRSSKSQSEDEPHERIRHGTYQHEINEVADTDRRLARGEFVIGPAYFYGLGILLGMPLLVILLCLRSSRRPKGRLDQ
jgi:hypothetical protein